MKEIEKKPMEREQVKQTIILALQELTEWEQKAFALYYLEGLDFDEIEAVIGPMK